MKVLVIPNLSREYAPVMTSDVGKILKRLKINAMLPSNVDFHSNDYDIIDEKKAFSICDVVIVIGGDGTIIHAAKKAANYDKPLLGINAGRVGYLAGIEADNLDALNTLITGKYITQKRMMLKVTLEDSCEELFCLNDAVVSNGSLSRLIDVSARFEDDIINYRADGLIAATPTGSTAYSMSAGGPVVDPSLDSIILTPICPHSLYFRSLIINPNTKIKITNLNRDDTDVFLTVDGEYSKRIEANKSIEISKSDQSIKLIKIGDNSIYKTLSEKIK